MDRNEMKDFMDRVLAELEAAEQRRDEAYSDRVWGWEKALFEIAKRGRPLKRRLQAIWAALTQVSKYGRHVQRIQGLPLWRQVTQQYKAFVEYGLHPKYYYLFEVHSDAQRMGQYLSPDNWCLLLDALLMRQGAGDAEILNDKCKSYHHFRQFDLPTIPILAKFGGTAVEDATLDRSWSSDKDLFSKPVDGAFGKGARRWFRQPDGRYRTEEDAIVTKSELENDLQRQSQNRTVILQPLVENHPNIQKLTGETLVSLRIITMRNPGADPQYLIGLISLPLGSEIGSNAGFAVLRAPINQQTGRLGAAYNQREIADIMRAIRVHPVTGRQIEGFTLPCWKRVIGLTEKAHRTLPTIALVGWDVALSPNGPLIIEGNVRPGPLSPQVAHKKPLGATQFPELYSENLEVALQSD